MAASKVRFVETPGADKAGSERGFTLIEMMITIMLAAILMVIGVPSFRDAALGSRLSNIANDLNASVQVARSEAIKRNTQVTLCMTANGTSCATTGSWEQGWIVLAGTTVLEYHQPSLVPTGFKVLRTVGTGSMVFQPIGVGASAATFKVCRLTPLGSQERIVTVSATGSASVTTTETGSCS